MLAGMDIVELALAAAFGLAACLGLLRSMAAYRRATLARLELARQDAAAAVRAEARSKRQRDAA